MNMGKYGKIAEIATNLLVSNKASEPINAWELAASQVFPESESSRNKSCPKNSFLGLCEDGYVHGAEQGSYTRAKKNKDYAIKALLLLSVTPNLNEKELWKSVIDEPDKKYNSQMDVVKTLWDGKLINQKNIAIKK